MAAMKAAVFGCGGAGSGHARKAREIGLEVVAFCDVIEASAQRLRDEFGGGLVTTDPEQIMLDDGIDVVVIATHHDAHHPLALAAAQAGKHMLVEKPMCLTRVQAIEVAEAVEKAGVKLVVNCKFRIAPTVQKAKELIPSPRISHGQLATDNYAHKPPGTRSSAWLWDKDDGGGLLVSTAIHTVDLLAYLMDSAGDRVYAEGRLFDSRNKGTEGYPDGLAGTILWKNGALSTVICHDQSRGYNPFVSKWFHEVWDGERSAVFSSATSRVDFSGCEIDYMDSKELPEEEQRRASMMLNLLEAIRTDGDTLCNAQDGVRAVSICNALDQSVRTGRPQNVPN
jgi:predicted dehydrogenase